MTDSVEPPESDDDVPPARAVEPLAGIPEPLARAMARRGFTELTSVQRAVMDAAPEHRDLRISSQTGSGKTVALGLALADHLTAPPPADPVRRSGPSVLILVPTRELAVQVRDELRWLLAGLRHLAVEVVMGGTSVGLERRALARCPRIVVGTPGRTLDHLGAGALVVDAVEHVVLDESDRMLDMGFREELEAILEGMPAERRTHMVSATFPAAVRRLADRFQQDALHIEGTRLGAANSDIEHVAHLVEPSETYAALVNLLLLNEGGRCLIFVERRVDATALAERLSGDGFPVQSFSGDLAQAQRTRTLNAFRDGTIKTLVSTDVAARGIDVPDIALVIHLDPPQDADSYVHRSGRTGRAGRMGRSVTVVPPRARRYVVRLLEQARIEVDWQPAPGASKVHKKLRKRFRRHLFASLLNDDPPAQPRIDYANQLLEGRDPALVVAVLLELAQPTPAREPMEVSEASPAGRPGPRSAPRPGFVRFKVNWGERGGAAPNRLLGFICRRGQIRGQHVGAIEVGPAESTFEVAAGVAASFERHARQPDSRDPRLRIVRDGPPRPPTGPRDPRGPRADDRSQGRGTQSKPWNPRAVLQPPKQRLTPKRQDRG